MMEQSSSSPSIENLISLFKTNVTGFQKTLNNSLEFEVRFGSNNKNE